MFNGHIFRKSLEHLYSTVPEATILHLSFQRLVYAQECIQDISDDLGYESLPSQ